MDEVKKPEVAVAAAAEKTAEKAVEKKIDAMALISYLGILCLVPYLAQEKDEFVRFHAKQGLVLFIGEVASWMLLAIPFLGFLATNMLSLVWIVFSVLGIVNVIGNKKEKLPVIGDLADKIKF
ncbi:MAG TPA: hypothetical protein P5080_02970 [Candidatus Paceibacterota bacterium]|nr:hypothetical protein [Candidatus Pacearchaeota archaeon]HRZ50930.1 hypothetical protein [Candidatus Paceibacterota bacterium]HSA36651.1 hypothetical protein [Candidatus Paceibacterota bacterium]